MAYEFYVTIEGTQQGKFKGDSKRRAHKDGEPGDLHQREEIQNRGAELHAAVVNGADCGDQRQRGQAAAEARPWRPAAGC